MSNYIINRLKVVNYRALKHGDFRFNDGVNIIVGDNEAGKSTLLECITLALSGQINGRSALYELHPMLFNIEIIQDYIKSINSGLRAAPPSIKIEIFFQDVPELAALRGTNNTEGDNCPGVTFSFEFDEDFAVEYGEYISRPAEVRSIPIE
jgi:predicted ATP-dependent endonuclease of OLD family